MGDLLDFSSQPLKPAVASTGGRSGKEEEWKPQKGLTAKNKQTTNNACNVGSDATTRAP